MIKYLNILAVGLLIFGCQAKSDPEDYVTETLEIHKISDHVYQHISFLNTESFGKVDCNGMIVFDQGEAIIFDTPADNETSTELISWVENELHATIKAIIPTHFHADCLGGLDAFHQKGIPSYANNLTIELARSGDKTLPENGFDNLLELEVGNKKVIAEFNGEGHTRDNVIGYVPDEKVIFGGCLIKTLNASKGNLEDANTDSWSATVAKLKDKYPDTKQVIPGHGKLGGTDLLDYTVQLFEPK